MNRYRWGPRLEFWITVLNDACWFAPCATKAGEVRTSPVVERFRTVLESAEGVGRSGVPADTNDTAPRVTRRYTVIGNENRFILAPKCWWLRFPLDTCPKAHAGVARIDESVR